MEEDTGKSTHVGGATGRIHGASHSLLDYNRAGIPLIEIVTKPIDGRRRARPRGGQGLRRRAARAHQGARRLRGPHGDGPDALRREPVAAPARQRDASAPARETKNVNSLRSVERAARFEIQRHAAVLDAGGTIVQETRHFHEEDGSTTSGRIKEEAEDYRYFPEPDLVPVAPSREWVEELRGELPELPRVRRNRLREEWGISEHEMQSALNAGAVDLIVATIDAGAPADQARKWWMGELARRANETGVELAELPITPARSPGSARWSPTARSTTSWPARPSRACWPARARPDEVVDKRGLKVVSDEGALGTAVDEAIAANAADRRQDPRRQGRRGRRPGRGRDEGHPRPGGRGACARADPGAARRAGLTSGHSGARGSGSRSGACR